MKIVEVFLRIIQFHATLKLYHFQTKLYGAHKASDKLYNSFAIQYDRFLEVYQGKYGRIPSVNATIQLKSTTDKTILKFSKDFVQFLSKATEENCKLKSDSDLCNIVDDMIADIEQFVYLLSFK